jgi:hypothetical protein
MTERTNPSPSAICTSKDIHYNPGKILSVRTRHVENRAALALRIAAHTLHHNQSALGHYYRRMLAKLGAPRAITATAHKLACVLYHPLPAGQPYRESVFAERETQRQQRSLFKLHARARALGYQLISIAASA